MERMHWQDAVTLLTGVGLVAAVFILNVTPPEGVSLTPATWNFLLVGGAAVLIAAAALYAYRIWQEGIEFVLGLWLVASPWLLGFQDVRPFVLLAVIGGGIVALMSLTVMIEPRIKDRF